jgi:hypothetical protein
MRAARWVLSVAVITGCAASGDYTAQIPVMPGLARRMVLVGRYRPQQPAVSPADASVPLALAEEGGTDESPAVDAEDEEEGEDSAVR